MFDAMLDLTRTPRDAVTEQHEPERQMLFCLGNVTYLLGVTPSNLLPHPWIITFTHSTLCYSNSKIWLLSNIQQKLVHQPSCWPPEKHGPATLPTTGPMMEDWVGSGDTVVGGAIEPDMQMGKVGESVVKEGSGGKSSGRKNGGRQERNIGTWDKSWTDF